VTPAEGALSVDDRRRSIARAGFVWLAVVIVAWGLQWPANKVILESIPPLWMNAMRSAIATVALLPIVLSQRSLRRAAMRVPRADLPILVSIALLHMVGFTVFSAFGLMLLPAGRSVVLAYTTPLWVIPGAILFLGERLTARRALGAAIGLVGLVVLCNPLTVDWTDRNTLLGHASLLLAALFWASSILHVRGHRWHAAPFDLVIWETALATVVLTTVAAAWSALPPIDWTPRLVLLLLYTGIPGTALAYWAAAMASRALPAVTTSLGLLAAPVIGIAVSILALGEAPSLPLFLAAALILGGVALSR
jgi:drug/metabolite transporter (DMT)-like permease